MLPPWTILARYLKYRSSWEDLCDRCGRCCFMREVDEDGDVIIDYAAPCAFLDAKTRQCTVYEHRFETCNLRNRITLRHALFANHLPEGCAYTRIFRDKNESGFESAETAARPQSNGEKANTPKRYRKDG